MISIQVLEIQIIHFCVQSFIIFLRSNLVVDIGLRCRLSVFRSTVNNNEQFMSNGKIVQVAYPDGLNEILSVQILTSENLSYLGAGLRRWAFWTL